VSKKVYTTKNEAATASSCLNVATGLAAELQAAAMSQHRTAKSDSIVSVSLTVKSKLHFVVYIQLYRY